MSTRFRDWVMAQSVRKLAKKINCPLSTVYSWVQGVNVPRLERARQLVKLAKGAFTLDDLLNESSRNQKRGR
jgi:hypothetical protein